MRGVQVASTIAVVTLLGTGCPDNDPISPDGDLVIGRWGGDNVSLSVEQRVAHVHIGCTNGDFTGPIAVDDNDRVNVPGSYQLKAYPVAVGPTLPAQLAGRVDGRRLTFTVSVNDTVEKRLVVLGPVVVTFAEDPKMGPCPICNGKQDVSSFSAAR